MACAYSILNSSFCSEISLVDVDEAKLRGEMLDLQHGACFFPSRVNIQAGSDYAISKDSQLCVITAGARQREGESRLELLGRNVQILKGIVPKLLQHSPDTHLMIVSNPVDVLTWVAWKISGLPVHRVFGSGTNLDSSRFRNLIAERLGVHAQSVHGYIVGEHGDSSVAVWSSLQIGATNILPIIKSSGEMDKCEAIHKEVVNAAYEIIKLKGYTNWAIGASVANLARSILQNHCRVHPISTLVKGMFGIESEVFLSVPCVLSRYGVQSAIPIELDEAETAKMLHSATTLAELQAGLLDKL